MRRGESLKVYVDLGGRLRDWKSLRRIRQAVVTEAVQAEAKESRNESERHTWKVLARLPDAIASSCMTTCRD